MELDRCLFNSSQDKTDTYITGGFLPHLAVPRFLTQPDGGFINNILRKLLRIKAVNREDKRSRRYRDRDFAKFEGLGAIEIANAVRKKSLAGVETAIRFFETQPRREREPEPNR